MHTKRQRQKLGHRKCKPGNPMWERNSHRLMMSRCEGVRGVNTGLQKCSRENINN